MKKIIINVSLAIALITMLPFPSDANVSYGQPDESKELLYQDMFMLFLLPHIDKAVIDHYSRLLTEKPIVYPYLVDVIKTKRIDGARTFHFSITLETTPVVGPHISVGKDRLTFEIAPTIPHQVKLIKFEHLETHELPPYWQDNIRKP
jgi:hypothetical protein